MERRRFLDILYLIFLRGLATLSIRGARVGLFPSAIRLEFPRPSREFCEFVWPNVCRIETVLQLERNRPSLVTDEQPETRRQHMTKRP